MSESLPEQTPHVPRASEGENVNTEGALPVSANGGTRRPTRLNNRYGNVLNSTPKDFVGDTPKLGGILGLRSENVTKKITYDLFCEKLGTYIMTEFKNGDDIFQVTKIHDADVTEFFKAKNKPNSLTEEKNKIQ